MQHGCYADPGTKVLWVSRDLYHRVSTRPHQQVVDLSFVLMRDIGDGFGQGENEVEIPHWQQFGLARRQPGFGCTGLTLGAMAITARVVGDVLVFAVVATRNMSAKRRCATTLDGRHHLHLVQADMPLVGGAPRSTMVAKDVRNL